MLSFRIQERHFQAQREWMAPKYGWRRVAQFSRWKTLAKAESLEKAKEICNGLSTTGLKEYRIMHGFEQVWVAC